MPTWSANPDADLEPESAGCEEEPDAQDPLLLSDPDPDPTEDAYDEAALALAPPNAPPPVAPPASSSAFVLSIAPRRSSSYLPRRRSTAPLASSSIRDGASTDSQHRPAHARARYHPGIPLQCNSRSYSLLTCIAALSTCLIRPSRSLSR